MDILGLMMKRMAAICPSFAAMLAVMFSVCPVMAFASELDVKPQVANLMPSPGRCELKTGQQKCDMRLNLIWEAPFEAKYCLWRKGQSNPIKCWENAWRGSIEIQFSASKKTWFELKNSHSDATLAKTGVSVTGSYKQRKRAQRRKRGIWRMF